MTAGICIYFAPIRVNSLERHGPSQIFPDEHRLRHRDLEDSCMRTRSSRGKTGNREQFGCKNSRRRNRESRYLPARSLVWPAPWHWALPVSRHRTAELHLLCVKGSMSARIPPQTARVSRRVSIRPRWRRANRARSAPYGWAVCCVGRGRPLPLGAGGGGTRGGGMGRGRAAEGSVFVTRFLRPPRRGQAPPLL